MDPPIWTFVGDDISALRGDAPCPLKFLHVLQIDQGVVQSNLQCQVSYSWARPYTSQLRGHKDADVNSLPFASSTL